MSYFKYMSLFLILTQTLCLGVVSWGTTSNKSTGPYIENWGSFPGTPHEVCPRLEQMARRDPVQASRFCLACVGYYEAGNQKKEGIEAVMRTMITRSVGFQNSGKKITVCGAVLWPGQASYENSHPYEQELWLKVLSVVGSAQSKGANGFWFYNRLGLAGASGTERCGPRPVIEQIPKERGAHYFYRCPNNPLMVVAEGAGAIPPVKPVIQSAELTGPSR